MGDLESVGILANGHRGGRATVKITESKGTRTTTCRPSLSHWDLEPESSDDGYTTKYEKFYNEYERYREKLSKASGTISSALEQSIRFKFNNLNYNLKPKELWEAIKSEFEARWKTGDAGACSVQTRAVLIGSPDSRSSATTQRMGR